jgi:hypothetical protein
VGKLALLVACNRLEVTYSSSWIGRKTHASWKKGLLEIPVVERRREWLGDGPMRVANEASYCIRLT